MAIEDPTLFEEVLGIYGKQLILGLDARNGSVATAGWKKDSQWNYIEFAKYWEVRGVQRVIFTDISRDGTLQGFNLEALKALAEETHIKITASGGMGSMEHLHALLALENEGVDEVIVGKAFYEGRVSLEELGGFFH